MEVFNDFGKHDPEESRDLDFSDVFGGPPRRFLMQDAQMKYSFNEKVGPEEDGGSLLWTPTKEKVGFGEERVGRRRHQSDDFYDDIFRGNESYGSLKRTYHDQDNLFGLDPGSRILSPTRDLSPRTEPFGASAPAQPRFSNQAIGDQEEIKHYIQPSYHQSPLSQDSQYNAENLKKETKSIDSNGNKFHFSIYKWAGRGVPMIRTLVNRNSFMSKDNRRFETMMKIECDKKDSRSEEGIKELDRYRAEEAVFDVLDSKFYRSGDENVAFEVNSCPKFHGDEVEQQGSFNWDSKASVENSDDPCEDNFLVQELPDDVEEVTESSEASEDIKALDAKIRQWSSGTKGNMRSLLSTLQYVLWPGSGWKPIALVDLIEANSVKRAYQKALLHLHPDKLQQKGAPSHHKYIAEKVFAILQEAWDHFNTLAPL